MALEVAHSINRRVVCWLPLSLPLNRCKAGLLIFSAKTYATNDNTAIQNVLARSKFSIGARCGLKPVGKVIHFGQQ